MLQCAVLSTEAHRYHAFRFPHNIRDCSWFKWFFTALFNMKRIAAHGIIILDLQMLAKYCALFCHEFYCIMQVTKTFHIYMRLICLYTCGTNDRHISYTCCKILTKWYSFADLITFNFVFHFQIPPRLIKLALFVCILIAIFAQVNSAQGKFVLLNNV